jgi:hypothetical protein
MNQWQTVTKTEYSYSSPITIRKWNGGSLEVKVGFVVKHPEQNCIVLEKTYTPAKGQFKTDKFIIKNKDDWKSIAEALEKLWPELASTISNEDITSAISKVSKEMELLDILAKYPDLLSRLPENLEILTLPAENKKALFKFLETGGKLAQEVISRISKEDIKDLEDFKNILDNLKLSTINSLVTHIATRLGFIELFEKTIHDDSAYERRGNESVHNLLKENIWMIDRNYSILHDDETLKRIIFKNWQTEINEPSGNTRPDFLCMSSPSGFARKQLVIIEIKRPSIKINLSHIEQVMKYKTILRKYSGTEIDDYQCFIVGREIDETILSNKLDTSGFTVKTYTDFISEARQFYLEYKKIIEAGDTFSF